MRRTGGTGRTLLFVVDSKRMGRTAPLSAFMWTRVRGLDHRPSHGHTINAVATSDIVAQGRCAKVIKRAYIFGRIK